MRPMHCPGYEPQPARPTRSGVADMYKERRTAEFDRLRELMADAIHADALRPQGERVGIINAILAIRQLQRPFEERDNLRGNARYWIDYACAYAEGKERAEAERDEARAASDRARALHQRNEDAGYCDLCSNHGDITWPCATIAALDGTTKQPEEQQ
ncbi:hypothetical protein [Streptomyces lydicus]|uniref:hypothetical protein n=1 Tax=Streptomyces lydicus TaxID=47763 RepID=UPI0037A347B1